jgi:hypothetical protein
MPASAWRTIPALMLGAVPTICHPRGWMTGTEFPQLKGCM